MKRSTFFANPANGTNCCRVGMVLCWLLFGLAAPLSAQEQQESGKESILKESIDDLSKLLQAEEKPAEKKTADQPNAETTARLFSNIGQLPPVITRVEAYAGRPYGIGKIEFRLRPGDEMIDRTGAILITEKNGRIRYPVTSKPPAAKFLNALLGRGDVSPASLHTAWFLFDGDEPLELTLQGSLARSQTVPVEFVRDARFSRIVRQWWKEYASVTEEQTALGDYPKLFETYLTFMLPNRLYLQPSGPASQVETPPDTLMETLARVFDVESQRSQAIQKSLLGQADIGQATLPLPAEPNWIPTDFSGFDGADVEVEPIATCVPRECFYLRFGTWQNQLWVKRLMKEYGDNLGQMISLRGWEPKIDSKFLDQMAIESTDFDEMFGGNLISDVAVIGNDMYMEDGASVGVILQARNTGALKNQLAPRRVAFAKDHQEDGAEIEVFEVDGTKVQFLKTPDNRYRSFYVISGNSHLITSSLTLVTRFLEAAQGIGSLATTPGFRYARKEMPLSRDDTIFLYLPTEFFQNLLGPAYQIELRRRNQSIADMQLIELAYLAARAEGVEADHPDTLIANRFLPQGFGKRADGSQLAREGDFWIDSIRGRRGFFTPISDLEINKVTAAEAADFERQRAFYAEKLPGIDPMFFALKRYQQGNNIERVVFDGRVAPFGKQKYAWLLNMIGPPLRREVVESEADIIRFSASLRGGFLTGGTESHQIFGAVQDTVDPSVEIKPMSLLSMLDLVKSAPWFVGSMPPAGLLDFLPNLGGQPDAEGYTFSGLLGIWRLQTDLYTAISMSRQRLEELKRSFRLVPLERPAHARLEIGDLGNSNLRNWGNVHLYERSWQTSIANARLLNMLVQQFKLSPIAARETAENVLDVNLVCTLGGKYELVETPTTRLVWESSSWPSFAAPQIPADYLAPLFKWFRGLELEVINGDSQFVVHGYLDIQRDQAEAALPSFNLFKGFGNVLSGGNSDDQPAEDKKPDSPKPADQSDR
ncbi:MAG: hypothetical protein MK108_16820 [Mariniblastus sp.]|nr:hypothetical protein [Mariniblastus sp.]